MLHAEAGDTSVRYVRRTPYGFERVPGAVVSIAMGSFGDPGRWNVRHDLSSLPVVVVQSGGTWQGCTASWATLIELGRSGPKIIAEGLPIDYHFEASEDDISISTALSRGQSRV